MQCEEALSPFPSCLSCKDEGVGLGTRCVLSIIKDAGAAAEEEKRTFGAWIADGEGLSMGKKGGKGCFGGGESFL
ncbi:hypothetical protein BYT27DRAFT_6735855 [Phlegmacium glaucopus]|nr:hypothetical protein BYT27DRAFT_6735855 [Phlegmacium glaucopus]